MKTIFFKQLVFTTLLLAYNLCVSAESLRVDPAWLYAHLNDKDLMLIDTRDEVDYDSDHIPGAVSFSSTLTYQKRAVGGIIVEPNLMQKYLRSLGIDNTKTIILYDGGELVDAARVFWAFEVYGLSRVKLLSPGFSAWVSHRYPTTDVRTEVNASQYVITINNHRIASKFSTQLATVNPKQLILDARSLDAYRGKTSTAKRFGHIPTALNYPFNDNFQSAESSATLRTVEDLKTVYSKLPKENKIILYCETGRVSSVNYLILRELGFDVSNYDGSWREWGNDESLPIE